MTTTRFGANLAESDRWVSGKGIMSRRVELRVVGPMKLATTCTSGREQRGDIMIDLSLTGEGHNLTPRILLDRDSLVHEADVVMYTDRYPRDIQLVVWCNLSSASVSPGSPRHPPPSNEGTPLRGVSASRMPAPAQAAILECQWLPQHPPPCASPPSAPPEKRRCSR